ncbi:armadillo-type protein [Phakopsora pachyrhizi]|nr:armadillo-type protein [Phakopsora pachyrhizi]
MVDTISSFLEILPDNDLKITYTKVKTMLAQSLNSKSKTENTKQFLDILLILLPKLTSSTDTIQELQTILTNQSLLNNQALNIQKLGFKLLTKFLEAIVAKGEVSKLKDLDGFLDQILSIEKFGKILPSAKKDRAQLLMSSISLIPNDKLHFIPKLLAEVVLGCKESNSETRYISYETLNKLGHKIQNLPGSFKLDWSALTDEDMAIDSSCEVNLEEYFKMISAGLAGQSPHMISATISALSRVLFEFNSQLKPATITELISTIEVFLKSSNREISKSAIGFVKVAITVLPKSLIEPELANLIPNLLIWTEEHKNFFRTNLMNLFKKLAKKFGIESIEKYAGDEKNCSESSKKFLNGLKKQIKKSKKKKGQVIGDEKNGSDDSSDDEFTKKPVRVKLNDAYEEVLYGSSDNESDSTEPSTGEDNKPRSKRDKKRSSKKGENDSKIMIEDEEDELMDLLEGPSKMTNRLIAGKLARVDKNKRELPNKFKNDKSGKLLIVEDDTKRQIKKKGPEASSDLNAYLEAINGEDGFRRTAQGKIKFNKRKKQGDHHRLDEVENELSELRVEDSKSSNSNVDQKNKRVKKFVEKETLGAEFKAKRAGGDMIKKTADGREIKPFGYLPMRNLNGKMRKNNQIKGGLKNLEIVGRKKKNKSNS